MEGLSLFGCVNDSQTIDTLAERSARLKTSYAGVAHFILEIAIYSVQNILAPLTISRCSSIKKYSMQEWLVFYQSYSMQEWLVLYQKYSMQEWLVLYQKYSMQEWLVLYQKYSMQEWLVLYQSYSMQEWLILYQSFSVRSHLTSKRLAVLHFP